MDLSVAAEERSGGDSGCPAETGPASPELPPAGHSAPAAGTGAVPRQPPPAGRSPGPEDVIFVTGFGPFGHHETNASWQAVSRLHQTGLAEQLGAKLIIEEVPVKYEYVLREMPRRWRQLRPRLVVHVGVSEHTMTLRLERVAHNGPYCRGDVLQQTPPEQCCVPGRPATLRCQLDLARTCRAIAHSASAIEAAVSEDAGRYVCDFTYFTSLAQDAGRAVFVHVPPLGMPYTANQMAAALAEVIRDLWQQVVQLDRAGASCGDQQRS